MENLTVSNMSSIILDNRILYPIWNFFFYFVKLDFFYYLFIITFFFGDLS